MKQIGKLLSGLWVLAFSAFFILSMYTVEELPNMAVTYRNQFESLLESFLTSYWFFIVFVLMWIFVGSKLAKDSGWKTLAKIYSKNYTDPVSSEFKIGSGYVGKVSLNGILKVFVDNAGLYLKTVFPFGFGHKPIFIPWGDVSGITDEKALLPEKTPKVLVKFVSLFTFKTYKKIELSTLPDQRLVIHWDEKYYQNIPMGLNGE